MVAHWGEVEFLDGMLDEILNGIFETKLKRIGRFGYR